MNTELQILLDKLQNANFPEDVFGSELDEVKRIYRRLSLVAHPDKYTSTEDVGLATEVFKLLNKFWTTAQDKIAAGIYGERYIIVCSPTAEYRVGEIVGTTDFAAIFRTNRNCILKIANSVDDDDLIEQEAVNLSKVAAVSEFSAFLPVLVDSFEYKDIVRNEIRRANVFEDYFTGTYSIEEVRNAYPDGIGPKDMAWMFRRLLAALQAAYESGIVHGGVCPRSVRILPEEHGLKLVNWAYSIKDGTVLKAIDSRYRGYYPPEIFKKEISNPDLYMAAKTMLYVLGANAYGALPEDVPIQMRAFFNGCLLESPKQRPQVPAVLLEEFDLLIKNLWGPRTFIPFKMPERKV